MWRHLRPFVPRWWIVALFLLATAVSLAVEFLLLRYAVGTESDPSIARCGVLGVAGVVYGITRVFRFHPVFRPEYRRWLLATPWTARDPLPLGPVHLVWQDVVIFVLLVAFGYGSPSGTAWLAPAFAVAAYLATLCAALAMTGTHHYAYAIVFGLGLALRLVEWPEWSGLALAATTAIAWPGVRRSLRALPWYSDRDPYGWAKGISLVESAAGQDRLEGMRRRRVGWPFSLVENTDVGPKVPLKHGLLLSVLVGWLVYVVVALGADELRPRDGLWWVFFFACAAALIRVGLYAINHAPPISLAGRLATGRLIIPGYDRVFVAPLAAAVAGVALDWILARQGIVLEYSVPLAFTVILLINLITGPTLGKWRLTGNHRIAPLMGGAEYIEV